MPSHYRAPRHTPCSQHLFTFPLVTSMAIVQRPTCLDLPTLPAMVPTRPACHWFEESCQNTAAATTQVHPAPCQSRPFKVKVVERQKQRRTGSDRPAPSAALLCRASSLAPLYQNPRERRGTGMDACPMWPNQSSHAQRTPVAMQRSAPNDLSAFAACQLQTSSCGAFTFKGRDGAGCCCSWRTRPASGSLPRPAESDRFAWWVHAGALGSRTSVCAQILEKEVHSLSPPRVALGFSLGGNAHARQGRRQAA